MFIFVRYFYSIFHFAENTFGVKVNLTGNSLTPLMILLAVVWTVDWCTTNLSDWLNQRWQVHIGSNYCWFERILRTAIIEIDWFTVNAFNAYNIKSCLFFCCRWALRKKSEVIMRLDNSGKTSWMFFMFNNDHGQDIKLVSSIKTRLQYTTALTKFGIYTWSVIINTHC